jgi:hypothetical protein
MSHSHTIIVVVLQLRRYGAAVFLQVLMQCAAVVRVTAVFDKRRVSGAHSGAVCVCASAACLQKASFKQQLELLSTHSNNSTSIHRLHNCCKAQYANTMMLLCIKEATLRKAQC